MQRKWLATPEIDAAIKRIYTENYDKRLRRLPTLRTYARQIGWPHWAVKRRGRELGLARTKEPLWTERELDLLSRYAHLTPAVIWRRMRQAGIERTVTAIHLKLKRQGYKTGTDYYSGTALAKAFGVDQHSVMRWIRSGKLSARRKGTARLAAQGGDSWLVHEGDVRRFIVEHPDEFDLRKVDQRWFLYVITEGEVAA